MIASRDDIACAGAARRRDVPVGRGASPGTRSASACARTAIATRRIRCAADGRLRAVHLCEYGAQAMAVHGGLLRARSRRRRAARACWWRCAASSCTCARIDDLPGALECEARSRWSRGDGSQQYRFPIRHAGTLLAEGRAAVMLQATGETHEHDPAARASSPAAAATSAARSAAQLAADGLHVIVHANGNLARAEAVVADDPRRRRQRRGGRLRRRRRRSDARGHRRLARRRPDPGRRQQRRHPRRRADGRHDATRNGSASSTSRCTASSTSPSRCCCRWRARAGAASSACRRWPRCSATAARRTTPRRRPRCTARRKSLAREMAQPRHHRQCGRARRRSQGAMADASVPARSDQADGARGPRRHGPTKWRRWCASCVRTRRATSTARSSASTAA